MVEDLMEGQPKFNVFRRRMPHKSWRVSSTDSVKDIRLKSLLAYLDDPLGWESLNQLWLSKEVFRSYPKANGSLLVLYLSRKSLGCALEQEVSWKSP